MLENYFKLDARTTMRELIRMFTVRVHKYTAVSYSCVLYTDVPYSLRLYTDVPYTCGLLS